MRRSLMVTVMLCAALVGAGCAAGPLRPREAGALGGGALGAGAGAIIGNQTGHAGEGAIIGGALGALTGAVIGDQTEASRQRHWETERELDEQRAEIERQRRELEELKRRQSYGGSRYDRGPY